jgi:nucleotide-binding universal stress UspA family protein
MDMNVIFATDFYTSSTTARSLLTRLSWSADARLELLHVLPAQPRISLFASRQRPSQEVLDAAARELRSFATDLEAQVVQSLGSVQHTVRVGDPTGTILEHAVATNADLVVIGGPGRAESASGKMSSLSAAVIDRAACSVLVARATSVDKLVVTDDRSVAGEIAARVSEWPLFRSIPMTVASVTDPHEWVPAGVRDLVIHGVKTGGEESSAPGLCRAVAGTGRSVLIARDANVSEEVSRPRHRSAVHQ